MKDNREKQETQEEYEAGLTTKEAAARAREIKIAVEAAKKSIRAFVAYVLSPQATDTGVAERLEMILTAMRGLPISKGEIAAAVRGLKGIRTKNLRELEPMARQKVQLALWQKNLAETAADENRTPRPAVRPPQQIRVVDSDTGIIGEGESPDDAPPECVLQLRRLDDLKEQGQSLNPFPRDFPPHQAPQTKGHGQGKRFFRPSDKF